LGAACAAAALSAGAAAAQTVTRISDGAELDPAAAVTALAEGPLLLRLPAAGSAILLGASVHSGGGGTAYVAASTEFLTFADVAGDLSVRGLRLRPGQAAVIVLRTGHVRRMEFDAARLAASAPPALAEDFQVRLAPVAQDQARRRFWGLLTPTGVNARAPGSPAIETVRQTYLLNPALLDIRARAGSDTAALRRLTAERFVAAIAAGDAATAAALMDPQPFLAAGSAWREVRGEFAGGMAGSDLSARLAGAQLRPDRDGYVASGPGGDFSLALVMRDGVAFVSRLEPR
jgi:hypothetical protein